MIHGAVISGLFISLVWFEQGDARQPAVLILNNGGLPSEQSHRSTAAKANRQARPLKSMPPAANMALLEDRRLMAPATVDETSVTAVPAEAVSLAAAEPNANTSDGKGEGAGKDQAKDPGSKGSPGSEGLQGAAEGYLDGHFTYLRALILKKLKYPPDAKKRGFTGRVTVSFVILENGSVTDLEVLASSGHRILDENVLQTIRDLGALPKPPVKVQIVLPISYSLD